MAEVQRAVRVAVAESRANERLRVHRMLDVPLSQRNHGGSLRQGSYVRVHGNHGAVDANARTVATTPTNSVSNSIPSISEDEKEAATQLQTVSGSVSIYISRFVVRMLIVPFARTVKSVFRVVGTVADRRWKHAVAAE